MAEPYNKLRSKLNRAVAAYLISAGAGTAANVTPANSVSEQAYPNTTVHSTISKPEVQMTGLRRIMLHISIKGSAATAKGADAEAKRVEFDDRISATYDAMMQSDDGQTLRATADLITAAGRALASDPQNADMTDFTCQALYDMGEGDGEASEEGCSWEEVLMFDVLCSPSNVD